MEEKANIIEPLLERVEDYAKTNFQLWKLKVLNKGSDMASTIIAKGIAIIVFIMFMMLLNLGLAFWLGDLLGKIYYGFFCVAGFYLLVGLILYFARHDIKKGISDSIISEIFS